MSQLVLADYYDLPENGGSVTLATITRNNSMPLLHSSITPWNDLGRLFLASFQVTECTNVQKGPVHVLCVSVMISMRLDIWIQNIWTKTVIIFQSWIENCSKTTKTALVFVLLGNKHLLTGFWSSIGVLFKTKIT